MNNHAAATIRCSVEQAGKLPPTITATTVCDAIGKAALPALERAGMPPAALSVTVRVESDRKIVAAASLHGKPLPEHRIGISDRALNAHAVDMLAAAIAADIASARQ